MGDLARMSLVVIQVIILTVFLIAILIGSFAGNREEDQVKAGKIVNGKEVTRGQLAYQASIQLHYGSRLVSNKATHFCGGAFLAPDWIHTASLWLQTSEQQGNTLLWWSIPSP